jgi:eukaryotic-like serine/threonine-protein kinase
VKWIAETVPTPAPQRIRYTRERWIWASVVAILLAALLALYFRVSPNVSPPTLSYILAPEQARFAYFTGPVTLSRDGRTLAFVATISEGRDLVWVRPLDAAEAHSVAGTEGASFPFWSWDDRSIGFFAGGKLKNVGVAGGPLLTICGAPGPPWRNVEPEWSHPVRHDLERHLSCSEFWRYTHRDHEGGGIAR